VGARLPERILARRLTPDEVVRISRGERIPHMRDDLVVRAIRRCALGVIGEGIFRNARQRGYLVLSSEAHLVETNTKVLALWGWWCAAARQPEATVDLRPRVVRGGPRVRVDLSPTGRDFLPAAMAPIGRACAQQGAGGPETLTDAGWIATSDVIEVDAPDLDSAVAIVEAVLRLANDERWLAPRHLGAAE
jgi:hypothetical protein